MQNDHEFAIRAEEGPLEDDRGENEPSLRFDRLKYLLKLSKEKLKLS